MMEIEVDQEAVHVVGKYCRKTPAEVPIIFERIAKEWYMRAANDWFRDKSLIPKERKIPEKRITKVGISKRTAMNYKIVLKKLGLNEAFLTSWLAWMFINAFKLKQKGEASHIKKW